MAVEHVPIEQIRIDGGTQQRAEINEEHVENLAEAMKAGAPIPPVKLFHDGAAYWLSRGFHRYHAHRKRGLKSIKAEVAQGSKRDAVLDSAGDNAEHNALPRSNADKRRSVTTLLSDEEWSKWSDREIARRCAVSDHLVSSVRSALTANTRSENPPNNPERTFTTKHGTPAKMKTGKIGKKKSTPKPPATTAEQKPSTAPAPTEEFDPAEDVLDPAPAKPKGEHPWSEFEFDVREVTTSLESVARQLSETLKADAKTKRLNHPFAHFYSYLGTVGAVRAIKRTLEDNLPAEVSDKAPGYLPVRSVKANESLKR